MYRISDENKLNNYHGVIEIALITVVQCVWNLSLKVGDRKSVVTDLTGEDKVTRQYLYFFVSAVLHSTFILFLLPSSSVALSYFNLADPIRKCSRDHSCKSSSFYIAILNATFYLCSTITEKTFRKWSAIKLNLKKMNL